MNERCEICDSRDVIMSESEYAWCSWDCFEWWKIVKQGKNVVQQNSEDV